jgi:pimeloyl-ACP methyl ester carboxylesterase
LAILFAATYPERTDALLLLEPMVRGTRSAGYPWAPTEDEWRQRLAEVREGWGRRDFFARLLKEWAPDAPPGDEFLDWFVTHLRRSLSPGAAVALFRTTMESDVSSVLPVVRVPTLVFHRASEREPVEYFGERVADCRLVSLPNLLGVYTWVDDRTHELVMRVEGKLGGLAVSIGARVASRAEPGEVLVTGTVRDLVAGSGIVFEERGEHELKGVPGTWRLYAVVDA